MFVLVLAILGGVTTAYVVIRQARQLKAEIGGSLSQGLSQAQAGFVTGLEDTREGLKAEIGTLQEQAAAGSKATADQLKAQAELIERQRAEIGELRAGISSLSAGIEAIRAAMVTPTPPPQTITTPQEERNGEAE